MFYILLVIVILLIIFLKYNSCEYYNKDLIIIDASYCDNFNNCIDPNKARSIVEYYSKNIKYINISKETFVDDPSPGKPKTCIIELYDSYGIRKKLILRDGDSYDFT